LSFPMTRFSVAATMAVSFMRAKVPIPKI